MNIIVSGVKKEYPEGLTVQSLIEAENVEAQMYVTVSVNEEFVKNAEFADTVLSENDSVEFLYFMGGGI
ncbi:MAG: sulfur carrier protein ThiS [Synergistaceae bacterium]|jgi:sulfur carrier protein|nr:sulfur carrier protein ThiS [Synergistaceae bacterium]